VGEHFGNHDIGKTKCGILESDEVKPVNGNQELFFKFFVNGGGKGVFREK